MLKFLRKLFTRYCRHSVRKWQKYGEFYVGLCRDCDDVAIVEVAAIEAE